LESFSKNLNVSYNVMAYPESPSSLSAISSLELPSPERTQIYVVDSSSPLIRSTETTAAPGAPSSNQERPVHLTPWLEMKITSPTPPSSNVLALIFGCLFLTTFVVLPNSVRKEEALIGLHGPRHTTTLFIWLAASCYATGLAGFCWLGYKNRSNHIWLADHIFL